MRLRHSIFNDPAVRDAAHQLRAQIARKGLRDWSWLAGNLVRRFAATFFNDGTGKGLQHLLSSTAALLRWLQRDPMSGDGDNKPRGRQ